MRHRMLITSRGHATILDVPAEDANVSDALSFTLEHYGGATMETFDVPDGHQVFRIMRPHLLVARGIPA